jgi:hypothetical protein
VSGSEPVKRQQNLTHPSNPWFPKRIRVHSRSFVVNIRR